ncbi:arylesterase [Marinospirillum sp.]|uniref:arylesterase n=1 Tax=Marinospirillum sp. TaxID=2183934 RepID=UPI003A848749
MFYPIDHQGRKAVNPGSSGRHLPHPPRHQRLADWSTWIRQGLLICLLACLLLPSSALAAQDPSAATEARLLVVGDSLSAAYNMPENQGWVSLLADRLAEQAPHWQVINASISGDTSANWLNRLPFLLRQHQPQLVLIELGGNDGLRGLPTARIEQQLERMILLTQEANAQPLLIGIQIPPNYGPRYSEEFRQVFSRLAERYQLPFVPFLLEGIADQPSLMQADGIHPTAEAQARILEVVWLELAPLLD